MTLSLAHLHILVTRPQEQAEKWAQQLQCLGATVSCQPVIDIVPIDDREGRQRIIDRILSFSEYQKAIFISQNAVRYGMQWLDKYWPQLPIGIDFFAIGQATAQQLQAALDVMGGATLYMAEQAMNSEALLSHPQLQLLADQKILIFRGCGGRTLLADELSLRGAKVDYCELYQRQRTATVPQTLAREYRGTVKQPITTVHSGESLQNLCDIIAKDDLHWLQQQPLLVPGDRVAKEAGAAGFKAVITAENATHDRMVGALTTWRTG